MLLGPVESFIQYRPLGRVTSQLEPITPLHRLAIGTLGDQLAHIHGMRSSKTHESSLNLLVSVEFSFSSYYTVNSREIYSSSNQSKRLCPANNGNVLREIYREEGSEFAALVLAGRNRTSTTRRLFVCMRAQTPSRGQETYKGLIET